MTTKEFIEYTKKQALRYEIKAYCTDDPREERQLKKKAEKARTLSAHLQKLWGGVGSVNRAVRPM